MRTLFGWGKTSRGAAGDEYSRDLFFGFHHQSLRTNTLETLAIHS